MTINILSLIVNKELEVVLVLPTVSVSILLPYTKDIMNGCMGKLSSWGVTLMSSHHLSLGPALPFSGSTHVLESSEESVVPMTPSKIIGHQSLLFGFLSGPGLLYWYPASWLPFWAPLSMLASWILSEPLGHPPELLHPSAPPSGCHPPKDLCQAL